MYNYDISFLLNYAETDELDNGNTLKLLVEKLGSLMKSNFESALMLLGGMGVALHYEQLNSLFDGIPITMAHGLPISGKSLAVRHCHVPDRGIVLYWR